MTALETLRIGAVVGLVVVGSFFLVVGTLGLLRLPNVYNRMHATSKATTLGASSMFLAAAVYFGPGGAGLTSIVAIGFLFATAPTGAHVISRAAHKMGVPFLDDTWPHENDGWGSREGELSGIDEEPMSAGDGPDSGDDGQGSDGDGLTSDGDGQDTEDGGRDSDGDGEDSEGGGPATSGET